jgi:hypothetical protein
MSKQKTATLNEKVTVNRDFSLVVPEGYLYSTDKSELNCKVKRTDRQKIANSRTLK